MIQFLNNLRSNIVDYAVLAIVGLIGALVTALKIQGFQLHKAQVQILKNQVEAKEASDAEVTSKLRDTYQDALDSFLKAGGTLMLCMALLLTSSTRSYPISRCDGVEPSLLPKCEQALKASDDLQKAQATQVKDLQADVARLENMIVDDQHDEVKAGAASGVVGGGITGLALAGMHGLLIGGPVGLAIGLSIGLLVGGGL